MKLAIEATEKLTTLDGVPVRLWKGRTEMGVECLVFVHRIAVDTRQDPTEFDRVLREEFPPADASKVLPLELIEVEEIARKMFEAYNEQGPNPWKTWDGKDVLRWPELTDQVREKWMAAARSAATPISSPEPQDPPPPPPGRQVA